MKQFFLSFIFSLTVLIGFSQPKAFYDLSELGSHSSGGNGRIEFVNDHLYFKIGSTWYQLDQQATGLFWASNGDTELTTTIEVGPNVDNTHELTIGGKGPNLVSTLYLLGYNVSLSSLNGVSVSNDFKLPDLSPGYLSVDGSGLVTSGALPSPALTATYVGYGNGANQLTGEAAFTYTAASDLLTVSSIAVENLTASISDLTLNAADEVVLTATTDVRLVPNDDLILAPTDQIVIGSTLTTANTNTDILSIDGSGNVEIVQKSSITTSPGGSDTQVQINGSGLFAGDADLTFTGGNTLNATNLTISQGAITSGTYTPTLTNSTNISSSTAFVCQYLRVGNVVTVSGKVRVTCTANGADSMIHLSIPIASNFTQDQQLAGVGNFSVQDSGNVASAFLGDITNDRATVTFEARSTGTDDIFFTFTYQIL